ncbi:bifunctional adenosylcobinamide kinase/adenosylcobinamide-phosphate guanylyltransferase [Butyrivibrio sp. INlla14]|uniref:bifunctional adenosylcobinamide kinase/adenosylcobinamide-phosphate guanylyltransferase n=1 Tax=Butyrivibrio sp. INlla14 TaxID=1520808 RepID=UPI0008770D6E|nr:bifunctional adenosylcobinamide kinase/adenosylcobinamide-phosphate guanylyltransferase [Butyrivibrio sp. INlla14]SCY02390.1 adenosylcobinamide kinase /adenosylcobinamide-phosphate guanylyltransferase [Butyrivibrio sp. INlla14]
MVVLIVGIPDSGKSRMAEDMAVRLAGNDSRYYIATMIPFGEEGQKRIEKHRKLRKGKGFETIECPYDLGRKLLAMDRITESTCLLECMSNLVGNEMHREGALSGDELVDCIIRDIKSLCDRAKNVVIVSNYFPMEDVGYDDDTRNYVRVLFQVNDELKKISDEIYVFEDGTWIKENANLGSDRV